MSKEALTRKLLAALCVAGLIAVMAPAAASAITAPRYASPTGAAGNPCDDPMNPCPIETAINSALGGDDVTLLPGTYTTSTSLDPPNGVTVHGTAGARPVVNTTAFIGLNVTAGTLSDVVVEQSGGSNYGVYSDGSAVIERVSSHSSDSYTPCTLGPGDLIRDSVCWYTGPALEDSQPNPTINTAALKIFAGFTGAGTVTVRNVTAVSSGTSPGLWAASIADAGSITVNATNVIADSVTGPADVRTDQFPSVSTGGGQTIVLDHSNFATESEDPAGGLITNPGSATNHTSAPMFMDGTNGDFRQLTTSIGTIDLGTTTGLLMGELDFEGQARNQGLLPDIGADEFTPPTTTTPAPAPGANPATNQNPVCPVKKKKKKKRGKAAACGKKKKKKKKK